MVGVSGRSKGCITCRRRKKGCDQKRPECGQCESRGRRCEGYDSDRMFVHSQQSVEINNASSLPLKSKSNEEFSTTLVIRSSNLENAHFLAFRPTPAHLTRSIVVLPDGLTKSAYAERCLENFFDMYNMPTGDTHSYINGFAKTVSMLYVRDEALRLALLANGTAAFCLRNGDPTMLQHARRLYGQGLQEMGQALAHPRRAKSEALLAVPRALGLFEILFGADAETDNPSRGWHSHAVGEVTLVKSQGPSALARGMKHQLFVDGRLNMIFLAVQMRKRTFLAEEEWKYKPWEGQTKTPRDYLIDILADTPGLLEDVDKLTAQGRSKTGKMRAATIAKCWNLHGDLEAWLEDYGDRVYYSDDENLVPIVFPSALIGSLTILYWTASLLLYQSLDDVLGIPPTDVSLSRPDRPHPRKFARLLARSVYYVFQESLGMSGAAQFSFSLGIALLYLRRNTCDLPHRGLIVKGWAGPKLPTAVRDFLMSMKLHMKDDWVETHAKFDAEKLLLNTSDSEVRELFTCTGR